MNSGGDTIGLYVHQHWGYNHPYSARTWTQSDWTNFARDLKDLGYNTILIWPMFEVMPEPPTESDRRFTDRLSAAIDVIRGELGMRVMLHIAPNVVANANATEYEFEKRPYFVCEQLVDPSDSDAVQQMMDRRSEILRRFKNIDGLALIDGDPGGYPGSTIPEYISLLAAHRRLLDDLVPNAELVYWILNGWEGWSRLYETGRHVPGTEAEHREVLTQLRDLGPEPWSVAVGRVPTKTEDGVNELPYWVEPHDIAESLGIGDRLLNFNYSRIEHEPSFPMTKFGNDDAWRAGTEKAARGVMGNAQTHCVQLPNIFAFARGAQGIEVSREDYVRFANRLIPGHGGSIVGAWNALAAEDVAVIDKAADEMGQLAGSELETGELSGLLFGNPQRFVSDLATMLCMQAALMRLASAQGDRDRRERLGHFLDAADAWQCVHGYQGGWYDRKLHEVLRSLRSRSVDEALEFEHASRDLEQNLDVAAIRAAVHADELRSEEQTSRILCAAREVLTNDDG